MTSHDDAVQPNTDLIFPGLAGALTAVRVSRANRYAYLLAACGVLVCLCRPTYTYSKGLVDLVRTYYSL